MGSFVFRKQPVKGLYLLYQLISTLLVRIPLWVILAIPRQVVEVEVSAHDWPDDSFPQGHCAQGNHGTSYV